MTLRELTRNLAAIPSHEDETEAGAFLKEWLREETTAAVRRDGAGNVFARAGPAPGEDVDELAFVGHHDVVPPDDGQVRDGDYLIDKRDGRLYGRGTADMKGALAAMVLAFRDVAGDLADRTGTPTGDDAPSASRSSEDAPSADEPSEVDPSADALVFASFVGEEQGGVGARHALEDGFAPDYAVVGEGSTNYSGTDVTDVAVAHKGRRALTVDAKGVAAHASEVGAGENAIYRATDAVDVLREFEPPTVTVAGERMAGSLTVTEIAGGSAWNVVPESCTVTVDERTVPGERISLDDVVALEGVAVAVDQDLPPMRCSDDAFAEAVRAAADDSQHRTPELVTKPHATDAGWLARAGTACVIHGPAEPGEAHTADESVSIAVLERCRESYHLIAERLVG